MDILCVYSDDKRGIFRKNDLCVADWTTDTYSIQKHFNKIDKILCSIFKLWLFVSKNNRYTSKQTKKDLHGK